MNSTPLAYTWMIGILATCIPLLLINKAYTYLHHLLALWNPSINPPTNINKPPFILTPISHHINPHHHTFHAHRYILHTHPLHHPLPPRICQLKSTTHTHIIIHQPSTLPQTPTIPDASSYCYVVIFTPTSDPFLTCYKSIQPLIKDIKLLTFYLARSNFNPNTNTSPKRLNFFSKIRTTYTPKQHFHFHTYIPTYNNIATTPLHGSYTQ